MPTLLLKFGIILEDYSSSRLTELHGPLFHRWLPDGKKDAITLKTGPNLKLKVWFDRRGFVHKSGLIVFNYDRRELDPNIIPKQAILDAGPLMGLLEIKNLSDQELSAVHENKIGDQRYIDFGKKVVKKLLFPSVHRFLNTLNINYGQYWIRGLEEWDSTKESLGNYCHT